MQFIKHTPRTNAATRLHGLGVYFLNLINKFTPLAAPALRAECDVRAGETWDGRAEEQSY